MDDHEIVGRWVCLILVVILLRIKGKNIYNTSVIVSLIRPCIMGNNIYNTSVIVSLIRPCIMGK